jgi:adenylosuccinate synthase
VGWFDLVLLGYAHEINRLTELFIPKLDILSGLQEIPVCVAYKYNGLEMRSLDFSGDARLMAECQPIYQNLPGWQEPLGACRRWRDLPAAARKYVEFIEQTIGLPVKNISVGSERSALIVRD